MVKYLHFLLILLRPAYSDPPVGSSVTQRLLLEEKLSPQVTDEV